MLEAALEAAQVGQHTYRPPKAVIDMCDQGLDLSKRYQRKGLSYYSALGEYLKNGKPLAADVLEKLIEDLSGLKEKSNITKVLDDGGPHGDSIAFQLLGGEIALAWAGGILEKAADPAKVAEKVEDGGEFSLSFSVRKVDSKLGIVFGWAIICKENGEPYFDTQDDHVPEHAMLSAATDFMASSRVLGEQHERNEGGSVVFAMPVTKDIAEAFGIKTTTTGLMIGVKPLSPDTLKKFQDGTYSGFSIGGRRITDREVA